MTLTELKNQAKVLGLKGYSRLRKDELERLVNKTKRENARKAQARRASVPTNKEEAVATLTKLPKGEARKLRKYLRRIGRRDLAATAVTRS